MKVGREKANHESLWVRTYVRAHGTVLQPFPTVEGKNILKKNYGRNYVGTHVGTYVGKDVQTGACRRNPSEPSLGTNVITVLCWRSYSHSRKPFPVHVGKQVWQWHMWLSTRLGGYQTLCNNQNCKQGAPDTIRWQNCVGLKQCPSSKRTHGRPNE